MQYEEHFKIFFLWNLQFKLWPFSKFVNFFSVCSSELPGWVCRDPHHTQGLGIQDALGIYPKENLHVWQATLKRPMTASMHYQWSKILFKYFLNRKHRFSIYTCVWKCLMSRQNLHIWRQQLHQKTKLCIHSPPPPTQTKQLNMKKQKYKRCRLWK